MIYIYAEYDLRDDVMMPHAVIDTTEVAVRGTLIFASPDKAYVFTIDRDKLTDYDLAYLRDPACNVCDVVLYPTLDDAMNDTNDDPRLL